MPQLKLALRGNLQQEMARELKAVGLAAKRGMARGGQTLKDDLSREFDAAGLGKLGRAWRTKTFPQKGGSLNAVTTVFARGGERTRGAVQSAGAGAVIRAKRARFLAIPTPSAPKRGTDGKKITPRNWPEARLGKLVFVKRRGKTPLLIVENVRVSKAGRVNRIRPTKKGVSNLAGRASVVMFTLQPIVRTSQRVNIQRNVNAAARRAAFFVEQEINALPENPDLRD